MINHKETKKAQAVLTDLSGMVELNENDNLEVFMDERDIKMTVSIFNTESIELEDLTLSLFSLSNQYRKFLTINPVAKPDTIKLYIKEIRSGSVITDLVAIVSPGIIPFVEYAQTLLDFSSYFTSCINWLIGKNDIPENIDNRDLKNICEFLEPIAKDKGSQISIQTMVGGTIHITQNFNSLEANAAQNAAKRQMDLMKEPVSGFKDKVVLYWYQARNETGNQTGDKSIIESVSKFPVKTIFKNDSIKAEIISGPENIFQMMYIVDVVVETVDERPVLYKIQHIYEKMKKE